MGSVLREDLLVDVVLRLVGWREDGVPERAYSLNEGGEFRNFSVDCVLEAYVSEGRASATCGKQYSISSSKTVHTHLIGISVSRVDLP